MSDRASTPTPFSQHRARYVATLVISIVLLLFTIVVSLAVGRYSIPLGETARILLSHVLPITPSTAAIHCNNRPL